MNFKESSTKDGVLVCFAVNEEAGPFRKIASAKPGVSILITGIGRRNSEKVLRDYLAGHSPELVFSCGFAGGLDPTLAGGTVVFFTENELLRERLLAANAQPVTFYSADRIAITASEKKQLRVSTRSDVVEMESETIQSVCREQGIPFATVRVISDAAEEDLPMDFNQLSKADRNLDYGKLVLAIAKAPWKIPALMQLQKRCRIAGDQLARVLEKVIFPRS